MTRLILFQISIQVDTYIFVYNIYATTSTSFGMAVSNNSLFDAATALFVNDIIDESEFVALYDDTKRKSPTFQYWEYQN